MSEYISNYEIEICEFLRNDEKKYGRFNPWEIRRHLALGEIERPRALEMVKCREKHLSNKINGGFSSRFLGLSLSENEKISIQNAQETFDALFADIVELRAELEAELSNAPVSTPETLGPQQDPDNAQSFVPIRWKGTKADLGRVYEILRSLIDCSGTDWERHFIGPIGQTMKGATDTHNAAASSKRPEINALTEAARGMKTEPD